MGYNKSTANEYEEPHPDAVADVRLYWELQREAQVREDAALREQQDLATGRTSNSVPKEPKYIDGRWVMS